MFRRLRGSLSPLAACLMGASSMASASCDAVMQIVGYYDNFHAIIEEEGDRQLRAAARLYPRMANMDIESFVSELDPGPSHDDLVTALTTARELAHDVITNTEISPFRGLDARDERDWLAGFIESSGCLAPPKNPTSGAAGKSNSQDEDRKLGFGPKSGTSDPNTKVEDGKTSILALLIIGGALGIAAAIYLIAKSRPVKIHMAERLPRHRISLDIKAAYTSTEGATKTGTVKALDVSLGGMKLKVPEPLENGTSLELTLPIGPTPAAVIWSNAHYAGILFEDRLDNTGLNTLLSTA